MHSEPLPRSVIEPSSSTDAQSPGIDHLRPLMVGKVDDKIYAPLKKKECAEFADLKELILNDSDSD